MAAVLFLAAANSTPAFAGKCYGLDPCYACRNCSACMHCSHLGGKCGVCGGGKSSSNPRVTPSYRPSSQSDLPTEYRSPLTNPVQRPTFRKSTSQEFTSNQNGFPSAAPQFERRDSTGRDSSDQSQPASESADGSPNSLDLNQFPFDPYTGLPNPNYRGKRSNRDLRSEPSVTEGGEYPNRPSIRSGQTPSDGVMTPYERIQPYGQYPPVGLPVSSPVYPNTPSYSAPTGYSSGSSGTQHVSGYFRKDGTYVHSYTRRARSR